MTTIKPNLNQSPTCRIFIKNSAMNTTQKHQSMLTYFMVSSDFVDLFFCYCLHSRRLRKEMGMKVYKLIDKAFAFAFAVSATLLGAAALYFFSCVVSKL